MPGKSIEIVMKPAYRKFNYLYIPVGLMGFFPAGKPKTQFSIVLESNAGNINAVLQYNSVAHV
jgi:hypothetical protein